jgi:hypothetical protein
MQVNQSKEPGMRPVFITTWAIGLLLVASVSNANTDLAESVDVQATQLTHTLAPDQSATGDEQNGSTAKKLEQVEAGEQKSVRESPYVKFARERAAQQEFKPEHTPNLSIVVGKPGLGNRQQH